MAGLLIGVSSQISQDMACCMLHPGFDNTFSGTHLIGFLA